MNVVLKTRACGDDDGGFVFGGVFEIRDAFVASVAVNVHQQVADGGL